MTDTLERVRTAMFVTMRDFAMEGGNVTCPQTFGELEQDEREFLDMLAKAAIEAMPLPPAPEGER